MKKNIPNVVTRLAEEFRAAGGRALLVGGCVRDMALDIDPKDFDVEVYGVAPERMLDVTQRLGEVTEVGRAFGIVKLQASGVEIDVSMPRKDSKIAAGHKGFDVHVDPFMNTTDAARRRDFTLNAVMMDPLTGEVIDPYQGLIDLEQKILRVVDVDLFGDDPLRVLRGMQFAARLGMTPDGQSMVAMKRSVQSLTELPSERLRDEWWKLLVLSEKPSIGLQLGFDLGVFHVLHPELPLLKTTPQNPEWHSEGDVWIHTNMVVDEAALIIRRENCDQETSFMIMLAALCHDLGKPMVTRVIDGKIRSIGHEEAGEGPTRTFLQKIGISALMTEKIVGIVKDHLKPTKYYLEDHKEGSSISDGAIRKLAARIAPATMHELLLVAEADYFGRGQWRHGSGREYPERSWLLERAATLNVLFGPAPHAITGQELRDLGIQAGPKIGELIREADRLRDDEGKTAEEIMSWIQDELRWL